ncbi:predicted protein [Histoplasma mississippiense (nom. inval.)]|uniref:predicted protein n=1 Tax=Ajellomyces capsulatus (strain NAm1 / WU24) TaxID=2059318 RepID=UPI000157D302|nr:predicted protein [Histoplasma mississippiense (nom. inval.)]EDN04466.1 predicted protein [Histoplasma mississippiense (nom. inval.)]
MANKAKWPQLGVQPQNLHEHATQLIAEATALLTLEKGQRQKLPDQSLESFLNSVQAYAKKSRAAPSSHEILDKLNQIHHIAKTTISDDLTLIKNAVNHAATHPTARNPTWADRVRSGGTPPQPRTPPPAQTNSKEREIIVKLHNPEAAALLRDKTPGELRERVNNALKERTRSTERPIQVVAAKQLKSGDVSIHTVNIEDANKLREEQQWTQALGREAKALQPTYGVLVHSVCTDKENIDPSNQSRSIEKIQTENATLHPGATITYVGWLTRTGAKKPTSSLVLEFTTKEHADRAIREGLVLDACYHHCELYDRSCKLKQCYKCQKYGHIGTQCNVNETCGYCAEPHNTRDCRKREEDPNSTPKPDATSKVAQPATRPTIPLFTGGTLRQTLDQRKRPAEAQPTERTTARPRRNPQSTTFHNFTQEDSEVFVLNKMSLHRAMEDREREMRIENEEYTPNRDSPIMTRSRTASQQPPVDPALIDPALTDLEMTQNDEKSKNKVMASLLRDERIKEFDVIAIQEPWRNYFTNTTHYPRPQSFDLVYLDDPGTRTCMFINRRIPRGRWTATTPSPDFCTVSIQCTEAPEDTIHIHNLYNPETSTGNSTIPLLRTTVTEADSEKQIVVGDFNLHHPLWGGTRSDQDAEAEELVSLMADQQLELLIPPGTATYDEHDRQTTIDLALGTPWIHERKAYCGLREDLDHQSDHQPIAVTIMTAVETCDPPDQWQWQRTNTETLELELKRNLPYPTVLDSEASVDHRVQGLVHAITRAIDASTPKAKPSDRSIPGWTQECKEAQRTARRLRRRYQRTRLESDWEAYCQARNYKARLIKKTLRDAYRARVREVSDSPHGLWRLARWARRRGTRQAFTPPLRRSDNSLEHNHQAKANLFKETFFPPQPNVDLSDTTNQRYSDQLTFPPITEQEITRAIGSMAAKKAPGQDGIPAHILQRLLPYLTPHLLQIYNASLDLQYCPAHFRQAKTVVLPKPNKKDLSEVKSYRPIALLNTLGKALESILATRISQAVEEHQLLPRTHLGGRKGMSTEHALHGLMELIYQSWDNDQVASLLLLDVTGAFDHVSHPRLLHNLRKRRMDERIVGWVASFLRNRTTIIQLREHTTEPLQVETGIPQGSPISPVLYLFYNADILEDAPLRVTGAAAGGWIDDIYFFTSSCTTDENCRKLARMHGRAEAWSATHGSKFDLKKYQLIHLTRNPRRHDVQRALTISDLTIAPMKEVRYLGVMLDQQLRWGPQIQHIESRTSLTLNALRSLAGSTWGSALATLRLAYLAIVVPQITYACSVWHTPRGEAGLTEKMRTTLDRIQREGARIVGGAYRAASGAALDVELFMTPLRLQLEERAHHAALNILTGSQFQNEDDNSTSAWTPPIRGDSPTSPLTRLYNSLVMKLGEGAVSYLESRIPFPVKPWWRAPTITITEGREAAERLHTHIISGADPPLAVYTDGSGIHGKVGAAALAPSIHTQELAYLGKETSTTVYAAELLGIHMGLNLILASDRRRAAIFTDNQAALKALQNPRRSSGQSILRRIIDALDRVRAQGLQVEFYWIPAHQGIEGNELADNLAKEATGCRQQRGRRGRMITVDTDDTAATPDFLRHLISAAKSELHRQTQVQWERDWENESSGRATYVLTPAPSPTVLHLHHSLHKALSSTIVQMRTGKIGLRQFLYERKVPEITDTLCECGGGNQTVRHVLLACPRFNNLRAETWENGEGRRDRFDLKEILTTPKLAKKAARFMILTRLLGQYGAITEDKIR